MTGLLTRQEFKGVFRQHVDEVINLAIVKHDPVDAEAVTPDFLGI
jgi:hypothetical protein